MITQEIKSSCSNVPPWVASFAMSRVVLSFLRNAAHNKAADFDASTGARIATYPAVARAIAWVLLVGGIAGCTIIAVHNPLRVAALVDVPILVVLAALVAEFTRVRVQWTDSAVSASSPWSAPRSVPWEDIVEVTYSPSARWFVVRGRNGAKIRLPELLGGVGELFDEMKRRGVMG